MTEGKSATSSAMIESLVVNGDGEYYLRKKHLRNFSRMTNSGKL